MPELVTKNNFIILIDSEDYEEAKKYPWRGYIKAKGRIRLIARFNGKYLEFSRAVFKQSQDKCVFFKNGNELDWRRVNIVFCNRSEFVHMMKRRERKESGAVYIKRLNKWIAKVRNGEKHLTCGKFEDKVEALLVADYFTYLLYGDKGIRNYPNIPLNELKHKYDSIIDKYGTTPNERMSKGLQGTKLDIVKTSQYVGVCRSSKNKNYYQAYINYRRKRINIGYWFTDEKTAALERDKKAIELYGDRAKLNFPERFHSM